MKKAYYIVNRNGNPQSGQIFQFFSWVLLHLSGYFVICWLIQPSEHLFFRQNFFRVKMWQSTIRKIQESAIRGLFCFFWKISVRIRIRPKNCQRIFVISSLWIISTMTLTHVVFHIISFHLIIDTNIRVNLFIFIWNIMIFSLFDLFIWAC